MATDYIALEQQLVAHLGITRRPVAIAFRPTPPAGVAKFTGTEPSGCSFWRLAAAGRTFYTVPADHANCAVGAHTHAVGVLYIGLDGFLRPKIRPWGGGGATRRWGLPLRRR